MIHALKLRMILLICGLVIPLAGSFGQIDTASLHSSNLRAAYNSSLIYPGATVGIDIPVQCITFTKYRKEGTSKTIDKLRFFSASLSYYHHQGFHDNLYILPEWVMRRSRPGPWFTEFTAGLGYSRTFLGGTTYKVDETGNVSIVPLARFSYAIAVVGFGVGYNYFVTKNIPVCIYSRLNMLMMFPYNSTI